LRLKFTPSARKSFLDALQYICNDNPIAAESFKGKVEETLGRLAVFPESGRPLPEFPELPSREVAIPPYRFVYRVMAGTVWIAAVVHCSRG